MADEPGKDHVLTERMPLKGTDKRLGLITLNRPREMNPLDRGTVGELADALGKLGQDKDVCVIGITGAGKAFSAGGDLKSFMALYRDGPAYRQFLQEIRSAYGLVARCPQPVVALVNGYCIAGGLELMLACDFAYCSRSAKIGDGHVNFGQLGGAGSNVRLPRSIAPARARELIFSGRFLTADEALGWGLVNRVVADGGLLDAATEFAGAVALKSPLGVSIAKRLSHECHDLSLEEALDQENREVYRYATESHDAYEGLLAFSEKRPPKFEGK